MRNKIIMWCVLCALMITMFVPVQAKADDFNAECPLSFDKDSGTITADTGTSVTLSEDSLSLIREGYNVVVYACNYSGTWYIYLYYFSGCYSFSCWTPSDSSLDSYYFISNGSELLTTDNFTSAWSESKIYYTSNDKFGTNSSLKSTSLSNYNASSFAENYLYIYIDKDADEIAHLYLDGDVLGCEVVQEDALYTVNLVANLYFFDKWCADAGLNCEFVDLEGQSVEYASNDMYVVRRGASTDNGYLYYLTRVNIERDGLCFPTLSNGLVGVATMSNEWQSYNVYQYEYDYALGCWCATENFVSQDVRIGSPSSGLNCALGNGKGLVYSNRDLYSGDFSVAYAESTEFVDEPFYGGINDAVTPTPTPEVPAGGFNIVTYSSQIKAEVKADSVNMRDKPSLEGSVVASFIKTWNVDVLGYVYADDGAVWYYCKTVRDDMECIGFIKAEYLTVLSVENNDFNIDFGDIDLEDTPELITTAKNSFIELLGFVGVVPMMIAVVFGFLPSWCLGIVGVSVVVICLLAIIKRG